MDQFLKKYKLPKLNKDVTDNLNSPITIKELELTIKTTEKKKSSIISEGFTGEFYLTFKEVLSPFPTIFSRK